jgi:gluconokinase
MRPELLNSQFDALEEPTDAIVVDAVQQPQAIADQIVAELRKRHQSAI